MYYRLKEPWAFRGWKRVPHAIRAEYGDKAMERPTFLPKEAFLDLLSCNGEEDVDLSSFSDEGRRCLEEMVSHGVVEESPDPLPALASWQRYHIFPSRYLESVHWSITGKCNFRCRHCLVSAPDAHLPQLPFEDLLHIAEEIARCGIKRVDITGGEPLLRPDFEQLIEALSRFGLRVGVVFTNASLLNGSTLDLFERYDQQPNFQLSFDGLGHHDWLRGVPGAEKQADAAFRLLQVASYDVMGLKLNAPQEFGEWKRYADEYALTDDEVWEVYRNYIPEYFADGMPLDIELDGFFSCKKGETDYQIHYVHHASADADWSKMPYCESVRYNMHIGPGGRAYPCMAYSDSAIRDRFPSILEQHLGDITLQGMYYDAVETKVADLLAKNPECAECEHLPQCCGGCMVQDMTDDGDWLVPDQRCCYFHKHIGEQAVRDVADAAIAKLKDQ